MILIMETLIMPTQVLFHPLKPYSGHDKILVGMKMQSLSLKLVTSETTLKTTSKSLDLENFLLFPRLRGI